MKKLLTATMLAALALGAMTMTSCKKDDPKPTDTHVFAKGNFFGYGGTGVKNYYLYLYDERLDVSRTGIIVILDLYGPGTDDSVIPDGTYRVDIPGGTAWGMNLQYSFISTHADGEWVEDFDLVSGTVTVTKTGDDYKVVMSLKGKNEKGKSLVVKSTFTGPLPFTKPGVQA